MGANYAVYIEDYVLSYLKREMDSLELSEIFFYGKRENGGRKFLVYGAGRQKQIVAFADYELLDELVCRLTQAGPVFMVREKNGDYKTCGFQTFYANNEAMQNYLIEWTSSLDKDPKDSTADFGFKRAGLTEPRETASAVRASFETADKRKSGSAISAQLGLILVVLVAIVISSTNSYHKMERMNQSAREVFFAIENQEAGQEGERSDAGEKVGEKAAQQEKSTEILVERNAETEDISVEDAVRAENAAQAADGAERSGQSETDAAADGAERNKQSGADDAESGGRTENDNQAGKDMAADSDASVGEEDSLAEADSKQEETAAGNEELEKEDPSEEALSRNITRYYEVERGDTLYTISQKIYGNASRVEQICEINKISNPDRIREGQKIILP